MATTKIPESGALFSVNDNGEVEDQWIHEEILGDDDPKQDPYYRDLAAEAVQRGMREYERDEQGQFAETGGGDEGGSKDATAEEYHGAFEAAFKDNTYRDFVSHYSVEEMKSMKAMTSNGGKTGVLVKNHGDGRIEGTALFNTSDVKGAGLKLLKDAIDKHGINYAEAYGPFLPTQYEKIGFETTEQFPFDDAQASPTWNYEKFDRPDYHIMRLKKGRALLAHTFRAATDYTDETALKAELAETKRDGEARKDPAWVARYGVESWKAALTVLGVPADTDVEAAPAPPADAAPE